MRLDLKHGKLKLLKKISRYLHTLRSLERVSMSLARGGATSAARSVDLTRPSTWEFSGFSQNGEDGIIDVLLSNLKSPNRYFMEIGASDGLENNTAWLAQARRYAGLWIEGDPNLSARCRDLFEAMNYGVDIRNLFVTREGAGSLGRLSREREPDVFSLDIDGNDYHMMKALLAEGLSPKVCVVEYNSAFGPDLQVTVPYVPDFRVASGKGANLFYGCSLNAWKTLFARNGYAFVTVERNGVNAFFARRDAFVRGFVDGIEGLAFAENTSQLREYPGGWNAQLPLIDRSRLEVVS